MYVHWVQVGIRHYTKETPSGGHASLGMMQQSQRLTLGNPKYITIESPFYATMVSGHMKSRLL